MVKEARKFSGDVEYPEDAKDSNDGSAQVRLSQELFEKYKGREFFIFITFKYCTDGGGPENLQFRLTLGRALTVSFVFRV